MSGLSLSLCSSSRIFGSFECVSIRYSVHVLRVLSMEYCKVQAREASSVASCIHMSYLYKSCFTNAGLHPCWLDVALLCRPMRIRKDREVSQQRASSTGRVSFLDIAGRCLLWSRVDSDSNGCDSTQIAFSRKRRGLATVWKSLIERICVCVCEREGEKELRFAVWKRDKQKRPVRETRCLFARLSWIGPVCVAFKLETWFFVIVQQLCFTSLPRFRVLVFKERIYRWVPFYPNPLNLNSRLIRNSPQSNCFTRCCLLGFSWTLLHRNWG